jgi:hypothetical protein
MRTRCRGSAISTMFRRSFNFALSSLIVQVAHDVVACPLVCCEYPVEDLHLVVRLHRNPLGIPVSEFVLRFHSNQVKRVGPTVALDSWVGRTDHAPRSRSRRPYRLCFESPDGEGGSGGRASMHMDSIAASI